jgi:hypothetical protein
MRRIIYGLLIAALLVFPGVSVLSAKTKHAPLPDRILEAKTVYIDNQSGVADITDKTYDELSKWGRFKIVSSANDADLVLLVSANAYVSGYRTSSHGTASGTDTDTDINVESQTTPEVGQTTYLTVIDPNTGSALWADLRSNGGGRGLITSLIAAHAAANAVRGLVQELRQRIDEQEGTGNKH